jgi:hypothetical protein
VSTTSDLPGAGERAATAAMDRVLDAERDVQAAIAECERESAAAIEQARS